MKPAFDKIEMGTMKEWNFTAEDGTEIKKSSDLALYLLSNALVAAVSGDSFGNPECIRFSFATSDELLKKAAERIKVALESLK